MKGTKFLLQMSCKVKFKSNFPAALLFTKLEIITLEILSEHV